jgi:phosphoglycerate dehydrogenase-like enzyme
MTPQIVVPDDFPSVFAGSAAESKLRARGDIAVFSERGAENEAELIRRIGDARAVINIRAYSKFTDRVLTACPTLKLISIWGTGTDNVDINACRARGVTVANTPGVNAHAVAEHTLGLMLSITRVIPAMDRAVRAGEWPRQLLAQLEGRTLGLIGFGAIGSRVAELARPFGMRVLVSTWGPDNGRAAAAGATHVPLEQLLRESDIVSLHMRLTDETKGILGPAQFALLKPTAFLINTARAALVDRSAMIDSLRSERIAGAALDVFHQEPLASDDALLSLRNVVLTPHDSGMTAEVVDLGLQRAAENVEKFLFSG